MLILILAAFALAAPRNEEAGDDMLAAMRTILPPAVELEIALSAAPPHLRQDADVYTFGASGFQLARRGKNGVTCLVNRDAVLYGQRAFKPTCWDRNGATSYVPVMLRVGELLAGGANVEAILADVEAGFVAGRFRSPSKAGVAYMLAGDLDLDLATGAVRRQLFPGHYMFYAVGLENADLGYAAEGGGLTPSLPFVFNGGAGGARLGYIISGHDPRHAEP